MIKKRIMAIMLSSCLMAGGNPSVALAANEDNSNLEYVRMGVELSNQIDRQLNQGIPSGEETFKAEVESKVAPGKKQAANTESDNVALDEFATDANNSNIDLFLTECRDYSITGTTGQLKGYRTSGIVYLTRLTAGVTVLEAADVAKARVKAKEIAEDIKSQTDSKKKMVRLVNKYITTNTEYIKDYDTETQEWLWSSTGPLLHGEAVCMGYAYAFKSILDELDIPAETIIGKSGNDVDHAWSRCRIDGKWYYNDITFDDPIGGKPTEDFLLLSKSAFYKKTGHKDIYDANERVADNVYHTIYRNDQIYEADALKKKDLFTGDDRGYRLEEGLTRAEMAVILTRVTGAWQNLRQMVNFIEINVYLLTCRNGPGNMLVTAMTKGL
ncbi:transglutaminase domain-containing protein [Aminipila terrae]|uniref:Transglutaminase-like domain-containing protein n=1 Tax=Aminipila terrae TaxID=2697030 RepID=A0A6P1MIK0_9FIRM|nr:transglutaminase domain-containing protein [Aminipila terrae]QHI71426.1 hypothetical protein Ami3637_02640 [Aminipila terrae]